MDLSKLPRMSNTKEQREQSAPESPAANPPVESVAPPPPVAEYAGDPPPGRIADAWISLAVGTILLLMYPRFLQWISSRLFGTHFNPFLLDGKEVPYPQVPEFWGDLGPTLFGIVLIVEGIALILARQRGVLMAAFGLTVAATTYNLIYLVLSFSTYGLAIISAMAVAFGIYIAIGQWQEIQSTRPRLI